MSGSLRSARPIEERRASRARTRVSPLTGRLEGPAAHTRRLVASTRGSGRVGLAPGGVRTVVAGGGGWLGCHPRMRGRLVVASMRTPPGFTPPRSAGGEGQPRDVGHSARGCWSWSNRVAACPTRRIGVLAGSSALGGRNSGSPRLSSRTSHPSWTSSTPPGPVVGGRGSHMVLWTRHKATMLSRFVGPPSCRGLTWCMSPDRCGIAGERAPAIPQPDRSPEPGWCQADLAAEVQDLGVGAEHGGDQVRAAG